MMSNDKIDLGAHIVSCYNLYFTCERLCTYVYHVGSGFKAFETIKSPMEGYTNARWRAQASQIKSK